ncbi:Immunoglobulin [Echinococcus multilocularis]|uniref:Immunoglobulin n=1 Tax=Echinococcus multilocularis TaxID=6211 RepID=A0A068YGF6_ECHMU|nr:Immunoglobulin [Echinococcus multilocularis]
MDQLILRQTRTKDTGIYTCMYRGRPRIVWAVTVLAAGEEPYRQTIAPMVYLETNETDTNPPKSIRTLGRKTIIPANIQIFTSWGPWSPCVPCVAQLPPGIPELGFFERGGEGFQMRVGTCYTRMLDGFFPVRPYKLAHYATKPLRQFGHSGLPCRSHLIARGVMESSIQALKKRPSELIIRPCYRPCPVPKDSLLYSFIPFTRGMVKASALEAADEVAKPSMKRTRIKDGDSFVLSCPLRGTVHSPISWFRLPTSKSETKNLTATALMAGAFGAFGTPSGWLAFHAEQVNLSTLLVKSRGRVRLDPAYHLIYAEAKSASDAAVDSESGLLPVFRLACVHGDARGSNFRWSDWTGVLAVETIVRWSQLEVITGLSTAVAVLMPAFLSLATVCMAVKCLADERKAAMRAAAAGRTQRPKI